MCVYIYTVNVYIYIYFYISVYTHAVEWLSTYYTCIQYSVHTTHNSIHIISLLEYTEDTEESLVSGSSCIFHP